MTMPLNTKTWKEKLLREQIHDPDYSAWLIEHIEEVFPSDWIDLVMHAAMPITEKADYYRIMLSDPMFDEDHQACILECINVLTSALDLIDPQKQSADTFFLHTAKWHDRDDGFLCYRQHSEPHKTFQQVLDAIRAEYADDGDPNSLPPDFHPDDFTDNWNEVICYRGQNGDFQEVMTYIVSQDGKIWNASPPFEIGERRTVCHYTDEMGHVYLPTPFEPGDILTVDCRPFHEVSHAVVIYVHSNLHDCCSPGCLGYVDGELTLHSVKHYYCGAEEFSPLLRIGICHDALPEEEKLIAEVGRFIKSHPGGAEAIDEWHLHGNHDFTAEELFRFMKEYDTGNRNIEERIKSERDEASD